MGTYLRGAMIAPIIDNLTLVSPLCNNQKASPRPLPPAFPPGSTPRSHQSVPTPTFLPRPAFAEIAFPAKRDSPHLIAQTLLTDSRAFLFYGASGFEPILHRCSR